MNLNPIDFDYVDGTNTYPLQDYIDDKISFNITSNIFSSNVFLNNLNKLNDDLYFNSCNLYLKNNIPFGEIRFSTAVNYPDNSNINYGTKIDFGGRLEVYHNYNAFQPTFPAGWYNVSDELLGLKADGISTDIQLTGLEAGILTLQDEIVLLQSQAAEAINTLQKEIDRTSNVVNQAITINRKFADKGSDLAKSWNRIYLNLSSFTNPINIVSDYASILTGMRNNVFSAAPAYITAGVGLAGFAILGAIGNEMTNQSLINMASNASNPNLYTSNRIELSNMVMYESESNMNLFTCNLSNLGKFQGFINSNIITQQYLNAINTNEIKISQTNISNIFVASNVLSNINLNQGFLNSNTIAQQYLNSLRTNELRIGNTNISNIFVSSNVVNEQLIQKLRTNQISLNFKTITKFSLDALEDWIRTPNGIYYDITNGNLGISATPNINDFLIVGGQTTIQGDLITETKMKITNTNNATPQLGVNGGNGDRIIFKPGAVSIYPYSLGISSTQLWYSLPAGATHNFYINGSAITTISSTGLSTIGLINASTNLQENGTNLTAKYLKLDGTNTMTGTLNGTTINASTNLQEAGTNLTAKYLRLDGTNVMTGQITGITTLSASTGLFGKLQTTNNTNVGAPSLGVSGGTGDKLILYAGSVSAHPYSLGINANQSWYSVPSWASNVFYVGGTSIASISSTGILTTGNIEISKGNPTLTLRGSYEDQIATLYLATPFTPTTSLKTAIISQGTTSWGKSKLHFCLNDDNNNSTNVDFTHARMTIQPSGNVGIGTHTPNSSFLLHIYTSGTNNALQAIDASGGTGQAGLRLVAGSGITPTYNRATRIDFYNNVASSSVPRWSLINDYTQTGTNDFRLVNAADTSTITILQNGDVGIGTNAPITKLDVRGVIYSQRLNIVDSVNIGLTNNYQLVFYPPTSSTPVAVIQANLTGSSAMPLSINPSGGNVGICVSGSPNNILQVGGGGRLRIANSTSDYTLIGTQDTDTDTNTRIVLSGNARTGANGYIDYNATSTGHHIFNTTDARIERMRIRSNGDMINKGYIYVGGDETNGGLRLGSDGYINFYQGQKLIGSLPAHINSVLRDDNSFQFQSQTTISPFGYTPLLDMNINRANFSVQVTAPTFICSGETYSYTTNWNGSGQSGWFVPLNRFWTTGHAYLTCAIYLVNANGKNEYCWFGRIFLSTSNFGTPPAVNGGCILISTDLRNPSTIATNNYYIYVNELTAGGVNALFIQVNNTFYAGTIKVKIYG